MRSVRERLRATGIRGRLTLMVLAMTLPWLALAILTLRDARRDRERETMARASDVARQISARVDDQLATANALLLSLAENVGTTPADARANDALLARLHAELPPYFNILGVWALDGQNVGSSVERPAEARAVNVAERKFFREAIAGPGLAVGDARRGPLTGQWRLTLGRAIVRGGRVVGVVSATARVDQLARLLSGRAGLPPNAVATLSDDRGRVIARTVGIERWAGARVLGPPSLPRLQRTREGAEPLRGIDGVERLVAWRTAEHAPWILLVGFQRSALGDGFHTDVLETILYAAIVLVGALFLAWRLAAQISDPIRRLTADAVRLGTGDLAARSHVRGAGEVGMLARAFNQMASTLQTRSLALSASEERYRLAARAANDVIWDWDVGSDHREWSEGAAVAFRIAEHELGHTASWWEARLHPDDRDRTVSGITAALRSGARYWSDEYRFRLGDDSWAIVYDRGYVVRDALGAPARMIGSMVDLTERRRAERERDRFFSLSVDIFCIAQPDGRFIRVNRAFCETLGWTEEELLAVPVQQLIHPDDLEVSRLSARRVVDGRRTMRWENRFRCRDGSWRWLAWTVQPDPDEPLYYGVARDVSEAKRSEAALRASEEWYRLLFDANPVPMWVYDIETLHFLSVNDAAVRHYGYAREEFLAMTVMDLRPPEDAPDDARATTRPELDRVTTRHRRKDGAVTLVEVVTHELTVLERPARLTLAYDVTERKMIEEQLRHSQKMEAVGQLAGGVAHDFNNLLTVINSYGQFLLGALDETDERRADARQITQAAARASALTRQLLAFSRRQILQPQALDLNEVIGDMQKLLGRVISENITLITHFEPSLGTIRGDRGQLEQVILNLVVNACDAMPAGGVLSIATRQVTIDPAEARRRDMHSGRYVMFGVRDTGLGMDRAVQSRIFEPFFTTKAKGKGTGLGLSTVYGIVRQSGGHIEVRSVPARGTTFDVFLPEAVGVLPRRTETPRVPPRVAGEGTILVAEDEGAVRTIVRRVLREEGFGILEACDGVEALELFETDGRDVRLVITDVVMPRMGGRELGQRLAAANRALPVVYMSGYADDAAFLGAGLQPGSSFLAKPFTTEALIAKVRDALTSAGSVSLTT